jgi:hypothetical protein
MSEVEDIEPRICLKAVPTGEKLKPEDIELTIEIQGKKYYLPANTLRVTIGGSSKVEISMQLDLAEIDLECDGLLIHADSAFEVARIVVKGSTEHQAMHSACDIAIVEANNKIIYTKNIAFEATADDVRAIVDLAKEKS